MLKKMKCINVERDAHIWGRNVHLLDLNAEYLVDVENAYSIDKDQFVDVYKDRTEFNSSEYIGVFNLNRFI